MEVPCIDGGSLPRRNPTPSRVSYTVTYALTESQAVAKKSPPKAEKRAAEPTASSRKAIKGSDSAELSKLRSDMAELAHKREQDKAEIERLRVRTRLSTHLVMTTTLFHRK